MTSQLSLLLAYFLLTIIFLKIHIVSALKKHVNFIFEKTVTLSLLVVGFILHVSLLSSTEKLSEGCEHAIMPNKNQTVKLSQGENTFKSALYFMTKDKNRTRCYFFSFLRRKAICQISF